MAGHRIGLYGPGGIGKTTLALGAPSPVAFFDLDESLPTLAENGQLECLDVRTVPTTGWESMRKALQGAGWDNVRTIVIDSATRAEELALAHILKTVKTEKGNDAKSIEDYGFGQGYTLLYEEFLRFLGDLDPHVRAGRHVVLVCHDCTTDVSNPQGEDFARYEPRLQSPNSGKNSVRLRVREWVDHLFFLGWDLNVSKTGKASGKGTRTLYPSAQPFCMAKSRTLPPESFEIAADSGALWNRLFPPK
jgi:hypothetical protein